MKKILINALVCLPALSETAVLQHFQQSSISIGLANADMAALADDPATAFYNPAGLARLDQSGFVLGMSTTNIFTDFKGSAKFSDTIDQNNLLAVNSLLGFFEPLGNNSNHHAIKCSNGNDFPVLGYFHSVFKLPKSWSQHGVDISFGLSLTSPWDFETDYKVSRIGTYTSKTSFQSFAVTPSFGIRFIDKISLGVGASYQQLKFDADNIFLGTSADVRLQDWQWTWNVGLLFELNACTRFGATYRPKVSYNMKGDLRSIDQDVRSRSKFTLPQTASIGFYQQITPCFDLMATIVYTNWSQFKPIKILSDSNPETFSNDLFIGYEDNLDFTFDPSIIKIPLFLQDTFFVSVGGRYLVDNWQIRGGIGYDSKPIKRNQRELRVPENNHYIVGFGLGYAFNNCLSFDFGYQFIYLPKSNVGNNPFLPFAVSVESPIQINDVVSYVGSTESKAQVLSFQMKWEF